MKKYFVWSLLMVLVLAGCDSGPEVPTEAEVKETLVGKYCNENKSYRLELKADGRYKNRRLRRNPFGGTRIPEDCEGAYSFTLDEATNQWTLVFNKSDEKSNPMVKNCQGELLVWTPEQGYVVGDSLISLEEPFDQTTVTNLNCGGI